MNRSVGIYLVQNTVSVQDNGTVDALRLAVSEAAASVGIPVEVIPDVAVGAILTKYETTYFVSSTVASHALVHTAFGQRQDVVAVLLVSPENLPGFDKSEDRRVARLRKELRPTDRLIADSPLSRNIIESRLDDRRVSVEVVAPDFSVVGHRSERWSPESTSDIKARLSTVPEDEATWSLGAAKGSSNYGIRLRTPGLTWGHEGTIDATGQGSEAAAEQPVGSVALSSDERKTNQRTIKRVFRGRFLPGTPLRVGILGHKLSFIDELSSALARSSGSKVVLDEWAYLSAPSNKAKSQSVLQSSDVVIGEWARPNNVWIQEHAEADTRLIVRAHRYEVTTDFPSKIDMEHFDSAVVIVPWVGRTLVQKFGWPAEKMVFIPNFINTPYFSRPKLEGAEFTLGMVGITPHLKRLDFALDLLVALRKIDPRFNLRVRGAGPLEHPHWDSNSQMRAQWGSIQTRLRYDVTLRGAVIFDPPGRDMASWYEQIGCILSLSDLEGSHVALAEGVASGAIAVARRWPGIETLWPEDIVFDRLDCAVSHILDMMDPEKRRIHLSSLAQLKSLDPELNLEAWWSLINGDRESAQRVFDDIDWNAPVYEAVRSASR